MSLMWCPNSRTDAKCRFKSW